MTADSFSAPERVADIARAMPARYIQNVACYRVLNAPREDGGFLCGDAFARGGAIGTGIDVVVTRCFRELLGNALLTPPHYEMANRFLEDTGAYIAYDKANTSNGALRGVSRSMNAGKTVISGNRFGGDMDGDSNEDINVEKRFSRAGSNADCRKEKVSRAERPRHFDTLSVTP
jgi:hypothetical protein